MSLVELATVGSAALPLGGFRDHLRLGSGFTDDSMQDAMLEAHLRAALVAVEALIGKALFQRAFRWDVTAWMRPDWQPMPIRPVTDVSAIEIEDVAGSVTLALDESYRLRPSGERQALSATAYGVLPRIPEGGLARVTFEAGHGPAWGDLPADLRQAVMILAAHYYETRAGAAEAKGNGVPAEVTSLVARHRPVRMGGGGGA